MTKLDFISFSDNNLAIVDVSAGEYHACVLFDHGKVICWGDNTYGNLGAEMAIGGMVGDSAGEVATLQFITFKPTIPMAIQVLPARYTTCGNCSLINLYL